jgi:mRNA-degrading endonuclease toxin of MazEF toxin-antitoxin module
MLHYKHSPAFLTGKDRFRKESMRGDGKMGRRSMLVVSASAYNRLTTTPVVLPITTGGNFTRRQVWERVENGLPWFL